eukprot:CAMPEP_0181344458 /NCGR_PEP_ID=MMETSP1101-20121128/32185_1 /TAXON_ID=46948 /ORGANISM="Rhodomonas abbreviata, Strain Caron Lab Isolate" /LENGTH=152 /DNA_ID=CAMNT_0023456265 /DNA_START=140 /DNA_END=598 /DNA_ORIENTATION=+
MVAAMISVLVSDIITIQALQGHGPLQTPLHVALKAAPALLSRVRAGSRDLRCQHVPGSFQELQNKGMAALDKYITNRPWVPPVAFSAVVVCAAAGSIWFLSKATGEVSKHRVNEISGSVRYAGAQIGGGLTVIGGGLTLFAAAYFLKPQSGK